VLADIKFGLVTVTVAPLTAAPFGSVTKPSSEPVVLDWPIALTAKSARLKAEMNFRMILILNFLSCVVADSCREIQPLAKAAMIRDNENSVVIERCNRR